MLSEVNEWVGRTAVITGAASGFGLEACRIAAQRGMNVVMADVQADALQRAAAEVQALAARSGGQVLHQRVDVSKADQIQALADATVQRFGAPHFVFNNAGVAHGGFIWEATQADWDWLIGVNLMGVVHGMRIFTPLMLAAAKADARYRGHIVNTASMAGLVNAPNMGVYCVTKHAVVSLSEVLYQDLALLGPQVQAHVLCPFFVPTGIHQSHRNRPGELAAAKPTRSQRVAQAMSEKAVTSGKVSAAEVSARVFAAMEGGQFYIYSHPKALVSVRERMEDVVAGTNPRDPFHDRPHVGEQLRQALRGE